MAAISGKKRRPRDAMAESKRVPLTSYEFLARQAAELPAYRSLKAAELSGDLRARTATCIADLAIYLGREGELCKQPPLHQEIEEPPSKAKKKRPKEARKKEPVFGFEDHSGDPQRARLQRIFAEYDPSQLQSACAQPDFDELSDKTRTAERGSLYAPFVTRSSLLQEVGLGLFAGRNYMRLQDDVCPYDGVVLPTEEAHRSSYKSAYVVEISKQWSVDARADPYTPGRYINHLYSTVRPGPNVRFATHPATHTVKARTMHRVPRGAEFFANYGTGYWEGAGPESDENTAYLDGHFLDYYSGEHLTEEQQEAREETEAERGAWADVAMEGDDEAPPPEP